jgi:hypothetical protein
MEAGETLFGYIWQDFRKKRKMRYNANVKFQNPNDKSSPKLKIKTLTLEFWILFDI